MRFKLFPHMLTLQRGRRAPLAPRLDQQAYIHAVLHQICRCTSKMGRLVDFALRVFHVSLEGSVVSREEHQLALAQANLAHQPKGQSTNSSALLGGACACRPHENRQTYHRVEKNWKNNVHAALWVGGLTFRLTFAVEKWFKGVSEVVHKWFGAMFRMFGATPATLRASVFLCTTVPERAAQQVLRVNPMLVVQCCAGPSLTSPKRKHSATHPLSDCALIHEEFRPTSPDPTSETPPGQADVT